MKRNLLKPAGDVIINGLAYLTYSQAAKYFKTNDLVIRQRARVRAVPHINVDGCFTGKEGIDYLKTIKWNSKASLTDWKDIEIPFLIVDGKAFYKVGDIVPIVRTGLLGIKRRLTSGNIRFQQFKAGLVLRSNLSKLDRIRPKKQ